MSNVSRWQQPDLSVWPAFGKLFGLQDELNRFFDSPLAANLLKTKPAIDIYESKDNVVVTARTSRVEKGRHRSLPSGWRREHLRCAQDAKARSKAQ